MFLVLLGNVGVDGGGLSDFLECGGFGGRPPASVVFRETSYTPRFPNVSQSVHTPLLITRGRRPTCLLVLPLVRVSGGISSYLIALLKVRERDLALGLHRVDIELVFFR